MDTTLYKYVDKKKIELVYCKLPKKFKGLYSDDTIYICDGLSNSEERCILAEEIGHYETSYGNILDLSKTDNQKQELRARNWAAEKLVTLDGLIKAHESGVRNRYELAEFLDITEVFLEESLAWLKSKYGVYVVVKKHIIYFEPTLMVMTKF